MHLLWIGLGGAIGAIARSLMGYIIPLTSFPLKILIVNVSGCLIMGILTEVFESYWHTSMAFRSLLIPGFLGGFTTFSTFALEFGVLYEKEQFFLAILYAVSSLILSLLAFFLGLKLIRIFS